MKRGVYPSPCPICPTYLPHPPYLPDLPSGYR